MIETLIEHSTCSILKVVQCNSDTKTDWGNAVLHNKNIYISDKEEIFVLLHSSLLRPRLEYATQAKSSFLNKRPNPNDSKKVDETP